MARDKRPLHALCVLRRLLILLQAECPRTCYENFGEAVGGTRVRAVFEIKQSN